MLETLLNHTHSLILQRSHVFFSFEQNDISYSWCHIVFFLDFNQMGQYFGENLIFLLQTISLF